MNSPAKRESSIFDTTEIPVIKSDQIKGTGKSLGCGTYGYVEKAIYKPTPTSEAIDVAIKYASNQKYTRTLINEAKIMMTLMEHPNVISIYGIYKIDANRCGLVMEYMDCQSLAELLHNNNIQYTISHFASWMLQLCSAVEFFHSYNQIHRDLKVQNILLCDHYRTLKLCDFGTYTALKSTMTVGLGTPVTMSPEVMRGDKKYDMKSDIYSIGIIMWQILSRQEPYPNVDSLAQLVYHVAGNNNRPAELQCSYILSGFYKRCWHQNPEIRPTSKEAVEYFTLLKKEYPHGDVPLKIGKAEDHLDVSNRKNHRRTGSDTFGIIDSDSEIPGLRGVRSQSVAAIITPSRPAPPPPTTSTLSSFQDPSLKPVEPDVRDPLSFQIYKDHMVELETFRNIKQLQQTILNSKHEKLKKWQLLEQLKILEAASQHL
ncbi:unnamed protein product [Caenorhabditis angaria]|uniref:Protein kinase domain-containing protein n=1 Tax=Caenorhabditis angaria TaxID=860376 RepID=A0A9P1MT66_9PELO|nr:unnamed protein product [Caenorhabditis angaria]